MAAATKTKRSVLMTQLLMLLLLVFATSSSAQTQSNVLLQGRITDRSTGLPIVGAKVTLYSWQLVTVQTDGNGMYSITTQQFSSTGTAGFGVTAPGYFAIAFEVNIAGPFPMALDGSLLPGGTLLKGTVTDSITNLPIANAVLIGSTFNRYSFDNDFSFTTDALGNYVVDSSKFVESTAATGISGQWLSISAPGYLRDALTGC